MADKRKIKLPKRLYYQLGEAAEVLGCTESDLLHLGANGLLRIAVASAKNTYFCAIFHIPAKALVENKMAVPMVFENPIQTSLESSMFEVSPIFDKCFGVLYSDALTDIELNGKYEIERDFYFISPITGVYWRDDIDDEFVFLSTNYDDAIKTCDECPLEELVDNVEYDISNEAGELCEKFHFDKGNLFVMNDEILRLMEGRGFTIEQKNELKRDPLQHSGGHLANRADTKERLEFQQFIKANNIIIEQTDDLLDLEGMQVEWLRRSRTTLKKWYREAMPLVTLKGGNPTFRKDKP